MCISLFSYSSRYCNSIVGFAPLLSDAIASLAPGTVRPSALALRAAPIGICRIVAGYYS